MRVRLFAVALAGLALVGCAAAPTAAPDVAPTQTPYIIVVTATPEPTVVLVAAPEATFTPVPGPWEFRVDGIIDPAPVAPGYALPVGDRLIALEFTLANNHWGERITANAALVSIMDGLGHLHECGVGYEPTLAAVYLAAGETAHGFTGCALPSNAVLYSAHYRLQETGGVVSVRLP